MQVNSAAQISVFSLNCDAAFAEDVNCLPRWLDLQRQIYAHRRCHHNFDVYDHRGKTACLGLHSELTGWHKLEKIFPFRTGRRVPLELPFHASQGDICISNHCPLRVKDTPDDGTGEGLRVNDRSENHS